MNCALTSILRFKRAKFKELVLRIGWLQKFSEERTIMSYQTFIPTAWYYGKLPKLYPSLIMISFLKGK